MRRTGALGEYGSRANLRVIGIDPGTHRMGVGVVDSDDGGLEFVYATVLRATSSKAIHERLYDLQRELVDLIGVWRPSVVSIEDPFVARNVKAAIAVGQAQAVGMLAAFDVDGLYGDDLAGAMHADRDD